MSSSTKTTRIAFGIAAVLTALALTLYISNWMRHGNVSWPSVANIGGLFVLTVTGAFDPPQRLLRVCLTVLALALILPSAVILLMH